MGSYYSDANMIFSKAMIDAYYLESKKAKYPRILIDNKIIERINMFKDAAANYYNLGKAILMDRGLAIVNPFELLSGTKDVIKNIFSTVDDADLGEYAPLVKSLTSGLVDSTLNLFDNIISEEDKSLTAIMKIIAENMDTYKGNRNTFVKYLWVKLLIDWIKNKESGKRFIYLQQSLNKKGPQ